MENKSIVSAKNRILNTASALFYKRGINNTGIDRIIADAGVAKATMYNNFASKEEIVATYLRRIREQFADAFGQLDSEAEGSVEAPFSLLKLTLENGEFYGCPFSNALVEMPESKAVRDEVDLYRELIMNYFASSVKGDQKKVSKLMLVYDGAFLNCKLSPSESAIESAIELARSIAGSGQ